MASLPKLIARAEPVLARLPTTRAVRMVEVGVYRGDLAEYLLERRPMLEWHGVDPWAPAREQPAAYKATRDCHARMDRSEQDQHALMTAARLRAYTVDRAKIWREGSPGAAEHFDDGSVDLIFVDGDHSRDGCLADCEAWWPKVSRYGWLGGHDYRNQDPRYDLAGVVEAVDEFAARVGMVPEVDGGTTWWLRRSREAG